jgi:GMP synthase (glutamine-hydrolysing)
MSLPTEKPDAILILDFGGQYCHLIARRVREMNVYSEIFPSDTSIIEIQGLNSNKKIKGIILSGSPASVKGSTAPEFDPKVLDLDIPVLGLCYGHQLIASLYGCGLKKGEIREYGITDATIIKPEGVLKDLDKKEIVWMSHGDTVIKVSDELYMLANTENCPIAAFKHKTKQIWGLQWHPEVVHTEKGIKMLRNFVFEVCECESNWKPLDAIEGSIKNLRDKIGESKAIIALSGGVDSTVAAALAGKALGDNLVAVHVDHGFMRMNES